MFVPYNKKNLFLSHFSGPGVTAHHCYCDHCPGASREDSGSSDWGEVLCPSPAIHRKH